MEEMAERLAQTEQLLSQLKMMIREKDVALNSKEEQLKVRHLADRQADRHSEKLSATTSPRLQQCVIIYHVIKPATVAINDIIIVIIMLMID